MWSKLVKHLAEFPDATLSYCDASGYPYSVRCTFRPDSNTRILHVQLTGDSVLQQGPASLLCHEHDEWIDKMRSFVVRGKLEEDGGWVFCPDQFLTGVGIGLLGGMPAMVRLTRRNSKRYLEKRGLPRPRVDWSEVGRLWSEAGGSGA